MSASSSVLSNLKAGRFEEIEVSDLLSEKVRSVVNVELAGLLRQEAVLSLELLSRVYLRWQENPAGGRRDAHELCRLNPLDAGAHNLFAMCLMGDKTYDSAVLHFALAVLISPRNHEMNLNLIESLRLTGRFKEGLEQTKKLLKKKQNDTQIAFKYVQLLMEDRQYLKAEVYLKELWLEGTISPELSKKYADLMLEKGDADAAIRLVGESELHEAHKSMILGNLYKNMGRRSDALMAFKKSAVANERVEGDVWRSIAETKRFTEFDEDAAKIFEYFSRDDLPDLDRVHLGFAMGKVFEDLGDWDTAISFYKGANTLDANRFPDDVVLWRDFSCSISLEDCREQIELVRSLNVRKSELRPIFVVGSPRSGSSILERTLSCHEDVTGLGELPLLSERLTRRVLDGEALNADFLNELIKRYESDLKFRNLNTLWFVDKQLFNIFFVGTLSELFPKATFLMTQRDFRSVAWSNYRLFFNQRGLRYTTQVPEIRKFLTLSAQLAVWWQELLPKRCFTINYERLVNDTRSTLEPALVASGLNWQDSMARPEMNQSVVKTASSLQVKEPMSAFSGRSLHPKVIEFLDSEAFAETA